MDKIILKSKDVETLLKWRDENKDLVRQNPAPFKGIILEFPDTNISIKAINDKGRITFYLSVNGARAGKIIGHQLPGGLYRVLKNTTRLKGDDVQSILTVYASLMALIVFYKPEPGPHTRTATPPKKQRQGKAKKRRAAGITYILRPRGKNPAIIPARSEAKTAGAFTVRGHYRRYKDGKTVWIRPYTKGNGKEKNKTYKL